MDNFYLSELTKEIASQISGRSVARVSLSDQTLIFDLNGEGELRLLASLDRTSPSFYLSVRTRYQRPGKNNTETAFLSLLRKYVGDAKLSSVSKEPSDRIVQIDFEKWDAGGKQVHTRLRLILTGRSANARLLDDHGSLLAQFFDRGNHKAVTPEAVDHSLGLSILADVGNSITQSEVLDLLLKTTVFGPQLRNEFLARCCDMSAFESLRSLIDDLNNGRYSPLVYSRLPLELVGERVISPKSDLLLSHIELIQAHGMQRYQFGSLSQAADEYYAARHRATELLAEYSALKQALAREIARRETAIKAIESDRARFENPEKFRRFGDLILANLANARVNGTKVTVIDYYDVDQREIQIDIPDGVRLQDAASGYFARYQKARRALEAIAARERDVSSNLAPLKTLLVRLEQEPTRTCADEVRRAVDQLLGRSSRNGRKNKRTSKNEVFGRRFRSSDGYEIVVGRNDSENDALTFRVARPSDLWLHAADYPGSHVIVRNPNRQPAPHRTITEAAELAAFYSQAKREGKAAVAYTQKKFVSKPPRSKPGLVRLSSFKTILVEPRCSAERLE